MALTGREKQARLKAKRESLGLKELRSIWLTKDEEVILKPLLKTMLEEMRASNV